MQFTRWTLGFAAIVALAAAASPARAEETPTPKEQTSPAQQATGAKETPAKAADGAKAAAPAKEATGYAAGTKPVKPEKEPDRISVQHILIGFKGSVPGKNITRTKEEAKKLAYEILERAWKGEDYATLVRKNTDDQAPGIYAMSNNAVSPIEGEYPRGQMVPAFGNVGFAISVGNIGIADFDPKTSPYGWHVIKRLK